MRLYFENDMGRIEMGDNSFIRITDISGLALANKIRNTASYAGTIGNVLLSETVSARTITVSGDIKITGEYNMLMEDVLRILNEEGTLYIQNGKKRCIKCVLSALEFSKLKSVYREFVMQFTADYPYFTDNTYKESALFSRVKNIIQPFKLPIIMTKRISEAVIYNGGDIISYPIIELEFLSNCESGAVISVFNDTTKKSVKLIYSCMSGERIAMDIENRSIKSSINGDITGLISNDTYLSDFYLLKGKNKLRILLEKCGGAVGKCKYKNSYIENI